MSILFGNKFFFFFKSVLNMDRSIPVMEFSFLFEIFYFLFNKKVYFLMGTYRVIISHLILINSGVEL